jgi:NTE family protein
MRRDPLSVDLALQGGGAHGAFTWGMLDRLLEEPWLRIDGMSGTSAGAMNAAVLAGGHAAGGADGARAALEDFWRRVSRAALLSPLQRTPLDVLLGRWTLDHSPAFVAMDLASRLFSPYDLNPGGSNPLRDILAESIDFERLAQAPIKVFVTATNVRTGRGRVFRNRTITADVLLASACLPTLFQAVEIDGEAYWDGGYVSNPPLLPLVERCRAHDVLLVRINSSERTTLPRSAGEIRNRVGEIVFDQPLERELALLEARRGALTAFTPAQRRVARHRLHVIDGGEVLSALDPSTKLVPDWTTLQLLHDLGRAAASDWLEGVPAPALRNAAAHEGTSGELVECDGRHRRRSAV